MDHIMSILSPVPQPSTDITADVKLPYIGTVYSLTCTIGVDPSVDTSVIVSAVWSRSTKGVELEDSNEYLDISDTTFTGSSTYEATLSFIPLLKNSTGQYFCDATVVPSDPTYIMNTSNSGDYQLTVQGRRPFSLECQWLSTVFFDLLLRSACSCDCLHYTWYTNNTWTTIHFYLHS